MTNSRTTNSIKNSIASIILYISTTLIGFIFQAVFIHTLGSEYNGIKGLFSNILSMLSIAELGFGSAIVYHLYKPVAEKNIQEIKSLVKYYRKVYHIIALLIFIIGIILLPMIPSIVGKVSIHENIVFLFFLYLINTVFSYLLTYKRSILYADQKKYITSLINAIFVVLKNIIQIFIIYMTHNFILYLVIQIIFTVSENLFTNFIINKRYNYIKNLSDTQQISKELKTDIKQKVKGLLFHKIGGFIVLGTDNIIISMTEGLGVMAVGMYSNYNMIIGQVKDLFGNILTSLTASIGNLLIEKDKSKSRNIYKSLLLANSWIFCFCSITVYCLIEPFIKLWIGEEFLLSNFVLTTLVINLYVQGMRNTPSTFKEAAGIFYEDRFIPLIESVINIVASLILVRVFGLAGVFIGTIISTIFLFIYSYPKYVYKLILGGEYKEYFKLHIFHFGISLIICFVTGGISSFIKIQNVWLQLILNGMLCVIIPNVLYFLVAMKLPEFKIYQDRFYGFLKKHKKWE